MAAMWERGLDMDDRAVSRQAVLGAAASSTPRRCWRHRRTPEVKARLIANTQQAYERGAFGSPIFFVGEQMFFGKDRLREVEEEIVRVS